MIPFDLLASRLSRRVEAGHSETSAGQIERFLRVKSIAIEGDGEEFPSGRWV